MTGRRPSLNPRCPMSDRRYRSDEPMPRGLAVAIMAVLFCLMFLVSAVCVWAGLTILEMERRSVAHEECMSLGRCDRMERETSR